MSAKHFIYRLMAALIEVLAPPTENFVLRSRYMFCNTTVKSDYLNIRGFDSLCAYEIAGRDGMMTCQ